MPITGKYLSATINGTVIAGTNKWSFNEVGDRLDATVGTDQGRGHPEVGVVDGKISIDFFLDILTGQYTFIRPGALLTNLSLFLDAAAPNPLVTVSLAQVFSTNVVGQVRDKWVVTADIESLGNVITTFF